MARRRLILLAVIVLTAGLSGLVVRPVDRAGRDRLPASLTDREFWQLTVDVSEPGGSFRSDNLLSNERSLQTAIPELVAGVGAGRVYLGVGPEQNYTYIAALKPAMAFIIDVRRGNMNLHLFYKAAFELSPDRAAFVSRLFSRRLSEKPRPDASAAELLVAVGMAERSETFFTQNLEAITAHLVKTHGFALTADDLEWVEYVAGAFFRYGPSINYSSTGGFGGPGGRGGFGGFGGRSQATYVDLMTATDANGQARSYLASEDLFQVVRDLHRRNLLVPVVGDFAGEKALRGIARYLRARDATVAAFYLSNVEDYLRRSGTWMEFCANAASLPIDSKSLFVRSVRGGMGGRWPGPGPGLGSEVTTIASTVEACRASR